MPTEINQLQCPACGAPVSISSKECEFCHGPIMVSTFKSIYTMSLVDVNKYANSYKKGLLYNPENKDLNNSIAMCYLKLKLYSKALQAFENAISENIDNSETYFYASVCLLEGKKAFLTKRETIDHIEEYINAAIMIEPKGIYHYFWAYIRYDYYFRKHYKISPTYGELMKEANATGYSKEDTNILFSILNIERPQDF